MKHPRNMRNTVFFFGAAALVVAICLYAYIYESSAKLVSSTINARKVVAANQITRVQGKEIVKLYESTADRRSRLGSLFVPSENAVAVIRTIESIGDLSGAGVSISSIKSNPPVDAKERIGQVTASVVINGTWQDVMQALELFETLEYQKDIRNVTINYAGQTEGKDAVGRWQVNFDISVSTIQKT